MANVSDILGHVEVEERVVAGVEGLLAGVVKVIGF